MRIRLLRGALALLFLGHPALFVQPAFSEPRHGATSGAVFWFSQKKSPAGALPGYDNGYTIGGTADGIFALAAAGEDPAGFGSGESPVDFLRAHAGDDDAENNPRDDAHLAGKVAIAAAVAGENPSAFGGVNLGALISARYDPASGGYRGGFAASPVNPLGQGLAILGLVAAGETVPPAALHLLLDSQQNDGGWEFGAGFGSDVSSSSMAVQALGATRGASGQSHELDEALTRSAAFFESEQNEDGGFSNQKKYGGNFCSGTKQSEVDATGFAVQALRALGRDPEGSGWTRPGGSPRSYLSSVQNPDGSFSFQDGPDCAGNGGSTYAAILGLEEVSFLCLLELGTCPAPLVPGPEETPLDPPPGVGLEAGGVTQAPVVVPGPGAGPASSQKPERSKARSPKTPTAQGTPKSCLPENCPPAAASTGTVDSFRALDAPRAASPVPAQKRSPAEEPISRQGTRRRDLFVWSALAAIFLLSGSIGRQLWLRRR